MPTRTATKKANPGLDRAALVERALTIADRESPDAVTIRRLATDFDVTPMALYWHFENKDALLAAMGDWFYDRVDVPELARIEGDWSDRFRRILGRLADVLRQHPASAPLAMPRVTQSDGGQQLTELTLRLLNESGFSIQQSADIARSALQTVLMLVTTLPGGEFGIAAEQRDEVLARKRQVIAQLPADRFPYLRQSVDALTMCEDDDAYFGNGTELFMAGVIARHSRLSH